MIDIELTKFQNFLYYYLVIVSIFSLYIAGTSFVSIVFIEIIYQFFGLFVSIYGSIYSSNLYLIQVLDKFLWSIYSFGFVFFILMIIFKLYKGFFKTITDFSSRFNIENKKKFSKAFTSNKYTVQLLVHFLFFFSGTAFFWLIIELIQYKYFSFSPFLFYYSILILIPPIIEIWKNCLNILIYQFKSNSNISNELISPYFQLTYENNTEDSIFFLFHQFLDPAKLLDFTSIYDYLKILKSKQNKITKFQIFLIFSLILSLLLKIYQYFFLNNDNNSLYFISNSFFSIFSSIFFYILISPILLIFNFEISFNLYFNEEEIDENNNESFTFLIKAVPFLYIILATLFLILAIIWGWFWIPPSEVFYSKPINNFIDKSNYQNEAIPTQLCSMKTNGIPIIQLSALPSLLYFFNSGKDFSKPQTFNQLNNIKSIFQLSFGNYYGDVSFNYTTLTPWGIQVIIPVDDQISIKKNLKIHIFGGYRTPFDWAMFSELFIQKTISTLIEGLIPGYKIASTTLRTFLLNAQTYLHYVSSSTSTASIIAENHYDFFKNNLPDIIVGQGIGGYFAKYIASRGGMKIPSFSFDSLKFFGSLNLGTSKNISSDSIVNIFSNGIFSELEDQLNLNFKRPGPSFILKEPDSFFSFCSIVAQCSISKEYHSFCLQTCDEFERLLLQYERV